ncbi:MAG: O-phosphoseryl-tRNA(Sec) selenium transferase [Candidatus Bathyarchaeota archaeon]|nr:O-phosphoseryl-tRNA(Sec) selenium transferase [Candidatus Bathyarchaeota archaeon]
MKLENLLKASIPDNMIQRGLTVFKERYKPLKILLEQRKVPEEGLSDDVIKNFVFFLSSLDTDKDPKASRVGEREAKVVSELLSEFSGGFNHGVGRSGDLISPQPKAPGGSLLYYIANKLALDALRNFGLPNIESAIVLPVATGMALALALSVVREKTGKIEVVYPRVDHKSPLKAIKLVSMKAKILDGVVVGDAVRIPVKDIEDAIGRETAAILSTTTFFPPREPDDVVEIAKIADKWDVFHVVNNAYGVQSREIMKSIQRAIDNGRVDVIVQSTDKNFLTPVGGSIIASPNKDLLMEISSMYPGRATASPILQFVIAILSLGLKGYEQLRDRQASCKKLLEEELRALANKYGERILEVWNPTAVAMTLKTKKEPKKVGYHLYALRVTGARVLNPKDFGVCCREYVSPYITMSAAIGCSENDVLTAVKRLDKVLQSV